MQIWEGVIHLSLQPSASMDNTLLDLYNSSYPTQPHSWIANYKQVENDQLWKSCWLFSVMKAGYMYLLL